MAKKATIPAASLGASIRQHYPQYWGIQRYPAAECACIRGAQEEWGIFGNFHRADMLIDGLKIDSTERLFHLMKFLPTAEEGIRSEYAQRHGMGVKMHMKPLYREHPEWFRQDWGEWGVDAMKYCLQMKYEQCEDFRKELERAKGKYIVEDETRRAKGKPASTWATVLEGNEYVGPNLLGRLLMELRDNGKLDYKLPADALAFIEVLK